MGSEISTLGRRLSLREIDPWKTMTQCQMGGRVALFSRAQKVCRFISSQESLADEASVGAALAGCPFAGARAMFGVGPSPSHQTSR